MNVRDCCYHVTHCCQEGRFLLRFKCDRRNYLDRLVEAGQRFAVELLDYMLTCNHVHLLLRSGRAEDVSAAMQYVQGTVARDYNQRKHRRGA